MECLVRQAIGFIYISTEPLPAQSIEQATDKCESRAR
jgi:hypothetical protein